MLRQHWSGPVTRQAHLRIFSCQALGIEIWPVRVEPPTANRRMAGEAVPFGVTRHARFEILASGLTMANGLRPRCRARGPLYPQLTRARERERKRPPRPALLW